MSNQKPPTPPPPPPGRTHSMPSPSRSKPNIQRPTTPSKPKGM
ncbi:hypothetical protein [Aquimarina algiphila]|nr:hypothetical protein [Aquimarina algiphila]